MKEPKLIALYLGFVALLAIVALHIAYQARGNPNVTIGNSCQMRALHAPGYPDDYMWFIKGAKGEIRECGYTFSGLGYWAAEDSFGLHAGRPAQQFPSREAAISWIQSQPVPFDPRP